MRSRSAMGERSTQARFHQASADIGKADGMAALNDHPSLRDCEHDCLSGHPVQLLQHAPLLRLAACRVVQGVQQVQS